MNTKQALLKAIKAVIEQGEPSVSGFGCAYRGEGGLKCVVGHLIPDENYCRDFERTCVTDSEILSSLEEGCLTDRKAKDYLERLQVCHDDASDKGDGVVFVDTFKENIKDLVKESLLPKYCLDAL